MQHNRVKGSPLVGFDLAGARFGSLLVVSHKAKSDRGNIWICKCDCGEEIERTTGSLRAGRATSCGCNYVNQSISHSMSETRIYRIWGVMKSRCNNPNAASYGDYGGRGIKVCERWNNSFEDFYEDMKEGYADDLFIDRKDNDGNYFKDNCKWSTRAEQSRNKRNNYWFEANGLRMIKMDWAKRWGVCHTTINSRLKQGLSFQKLYDDYENRSH